MSLTREARLLLIDPQERLMPAIDGGDRVVVRCLVLLQAARLLGVEVRATEHSADRIGPLVPVLRGGLAEGEILAKRHFAATAEPDLVFLAPAYVLAGAEAHVCVLQTALGLLALGRRVAVVADAVGSRHASDKAAALARLAARGAEIVTTEMVLFEWLGSADHPAFRQVLGLVKGL